MPSDSPTALICDLLKAGVDASLIARVQALVPHLPRPGYCQYYTSVYALLDPRENVWFYIGVSISPHARLEAHRKDRASAAWERIQEIEGSGYACEIEIIDEFEDRNEALRLEYELINTLSGLVNRERRLQQIFDYSAVSK